MFSPSIALASASATAMRICCSASLTCDVALEGGRLLADRLFLLELGERTACSRWASRVPISRCLLALATWIDLVALGVGHADFAHLLLVGHVAAGLLNRLRRGLLADGVDVARSRR